MDYKAMHEQADKMTLAQAYEYLGREPSSRERYYLLGLACLNAHNDDEAYRSFRIILSSDPQDIGARWGIAEVLRRRHKVGESRKLAEEVVKAELEFSPALITLAYIEYTEMRFKKALRLAASVLRQGRARVDTSNYARAYLILSGARGMLAYYGGPLSKLIDGAAVLPNIRRAQKLQPDSAGVLYALGSFYLLAPKFAGGDINRAEGYLKKAAEADPLFADIYVRLAQVYKVRGDEKKYNGYLEEALKVDPQNQLALDVKSGECKFICVGN